MRSNELWIRASSSGSGGGRRVAEAGAERDDVGDPVVELGRDVRPGWRGHSLGERRDVVLAEAAG